MNIYDASTKMAIISIRHITYMTDQWLERQHIRHAIYPKGAYGWIIWTDVEDPFDHYPGDLAELCRYASRHGISWVMLDVDYDEVDGLPVYDDWGD